MPRKTRLYAYHKDGTFFRSFKDCYEAKAFLNVEDISHISKSINGKRPTAFGYMWSRIRSKDLVATKEREQLYVIVDVVRNKVIAKVDNYAGIAAFFHCKIPQIKKGIKHNEKNLFRQRFRFDKESKHRLPKE